MTDRSTDDVAPTSGPWSIGHAIMRGSARLCEWPEVPIHVGDGANRGNCFVHVMGGGKGATSATMEAAMANARLIAAAPDLLALARQYASECSSCGGTGEVGWSKAEASPCPDCEDVRAVINKAEGRV